MAKQSPIIRSKAEMSEADLCEEVNQQFLLAKRYLDVVHLRMNQQEEMYRMFIDKNSYPHGARVFDPRVFRIIETITPRMVANEPTGTFYPQESGDILTSQILQALMKYDWRRAEMFPKLVMFVKSLLIFGTAFGRTYWDFRECDRHRMIPKKINGRMVWTPKSTEVYKYTEFDGPNFETLNIYDCFPDPNSTSLNNMRWFIYRTFSTLEELEKENDARTVPGQPAYWKNLDKLKTLMEDKKSKDQQVAGGRPSDLQFREFRRRMLSTQEFIGQDSTNPEVVILRRMTKNGWTFIVPEYGLVIREVENPYFHNELPIIYGVDYPYPGELYGMGEIEPIDRIQRAINAVLNQRLDNVQLTLRTMWKVKKDSGVDLHTLISAPGNIVTTDDMNAVEALQTPDVTGPTFVQTMNYLTAAMQNGSGITDYTQGIQEDQNITNNTATGIRLIQQEANAQFKLKIQLFNHQVIQRIANQWKDLRIQYTTDAQKLRILGSDQVKYLRDNTNLTQTTMDGEQIYPGEQDKQAKMEIAQDGSFAFLNLLPDDIQPSIVGDYDFIAEPSSDQLSDPLAMQSNFMQAVNTINNPLWIQGLQAQGKQPNYISLTQKLFNNLDLGVTDNDALADFKPPQGPAAPQPKESINFKDLPPEGQVQMAQQAGLNLQPQTQQSQPEGSAQPMSTDQMNSVMGQQQGQNQAIQQMIGGQNGGS